jgi:hypothetical protein
MLLATALRHFPGGDGREPMGCVNWPWFPLYVLVYELTDDAVRILRIWHGAQER